MSVLNFMYHLSKECSLKHSYLQNLAIKVRLNRVNFIWATTGIWKTNINSTFSGGLTPTFLIDLIKSFLIFMLDPRSFVDETNLKKEGYCTFLSS